MAAVTADQIPNIRATNNMVEETHAVATSATVYLGTLANFTTAGRITSATAAASRRFAGEIVELVNESGSTLSAITGNTAGTVKVKIRYGHQIHLGVITAARTYTNLGKHVYVADNYNVSDTAVGTAGVRVVVGQLVELTDSKTKGWIALRVMGDTNAV